ncbi:MAG TPA: DNA-binding transcriptional regulator [Niabella sp.]|nr:DNA-binding transcriptional regulator [Chitinophagaceae bacterium]HRO85293.1 DNA-binding transcriptional regulator [Niabella sp.]
MNKIILLIDNSEQYGRSLLKGIVRYSKEKGPWLFCRMPLFYRETLKMKGIIKFAKDWGAQGIIGQLYNDKGIEMALKAGLHLIGEDFKERFAEIPNITGGYHEAGRMGAEYFLQKGFKNFAFYGYTNIVWSRERLEGFEGYLNLKGYKVNNFDQTQIPGRGLWYYKPSELSEWLKSLPKPVAIMACDDDKAQHITEACNQAGIHIPEEVAVLGVDNDEMTCNLSDPPISSIHLDTERGGYEAAKLMDKLIKKEVTKYSDILVKPTHIVTRQSTDIISASDQYMAKALKYIHLNIDNDIRVADVLKEVPLCRRSFEKRFKDTTGKGVYQYVLSLRMQKIAEKLLETDKPVNEIAFEVGINMSNNISRQFKQIKGCTPSEYRRRHTIKR